MHTDLTEFELSVDSVVKVDRGAEVPMIKIGLTELAAAQKADSSLSTA